MSCKFSYAVFPIALINDSRYSSLSSEAKILYVLMLNRKKASARNPKRFRDDKGVFVCYPKQEIAAHLGCCISTATKTLSALIEAGLIVRKETRQGLICCYYVNDICQTESDNGDTKCADNSYSFDVARAEETARTNRKRFGDAKYIKERKAFSRSVP